MSSSISTETMTAAPPGASGEAASSDAPVLSISDIQNYGSLTVNGSSSTVTINGVQNAGSAKVILRTNIDGSGSFADSSKYGGDTEEIDGSVASGVTIISGHKTLILDHAKAFAGVFSGIAVDLTDITADSYAFDKNTGVATFF